MIKTKKNIKDIRVDVPEGSSGNWSIEKFTVSDEEAQRFNIITTYSFGGKQEIKGALSAHICSRV